eukprot:7128730-Pyramimonas_sp.AAC.1
MRISGDRGLTSCSGHLATQKCEGVSGESGRTTMVLQVEQASGMTYMCIVKESDSALLQFSWLSI